jgi:Putative Ig domain
MTPPQPRATPPTATCVSITAVQGVAITPVTMTGSGGAGGPYSFSATGLPAGLTMSSSGTISGTPAVNGTFSYTITVEDAAGSTGTVNCSATVAPPAIRTEDARAVLLAEYAAMRSEIGTMQSLQGQFLSMSLVLVGACIAVTASDAFSKQAPGYASWAAIPFGILALLYADVTARIMKPASYIHRHLRRELKNLAGPCLEWENFLRGKHPGSRLAWWLDMLRWSFFLGPGLLLTGEAFATQQKGWPWLQRWLPWVDVGMLVVCCGVVFWVERVRQEVVQE